MLLLLVDSNDEQNMIILSLYGGVGVDEEGLNELHKGAEEQERCGGGLTSL